MGWQRCGDMVTSITQSSMDIRGSFVEVAVEEAYEGVEEYVDGAGRVFAQCDRAAVASPRERTEREGCSRVCGACGRSA